GRDGVSQSDRLDERRRTRSPCAARRETIGRDRPSSKGGGGAARRRGKAGRLQLPHRRSHRDFERFPLIAESLTRAPRRAGGCRSAVALQCEPSDDVIVASMASAATAYPEAFGTRSRD